MASLTGLCIGVDFEGNHIGRRRGGWQFGEGVLQGREKSRLRDRIQDGARFQSVPDFGWWIKDFML